MVDTYSNIIFVNYSSKKGDEIMYKSIIIVIMSILLISCMGGVKLIDIDRSQTKTIEIKTTTGQELNDLMEALDSGAITEKEYNKLKKKIVERLDESIDINEDE